MRIRKRIMAIITVLVMVLQVLCIDMGNVYALDSSEIFSNEALVVDINTDEVLYSKNTNDESVQIASLTKIMTYVLAIENIEDLNTKIEVPTGTKKDITDKGGSNAGLNDNYEYTAIDLLYGLMLPSGCDAADVLATYVGDGDYNKFIEMMNEKAEMLGMEDTVFYSASGLEENGMNNLSTEQDLYKLAKYAFELPYFQEIIGTEFYEIIGTRGSSTKSNTVRNTNYMMGEYNGAEYYYIYSLGGKTGNLSGAGRCLISFAKKGDLEVMAITLGVPNQHSNYHLTDHRKLFEYVFEEYTENITIDLGTEYKSVAIGEKIQIIPEVSADTTITWTSSDEAVATVNEYGVVTGNKLGQAKIVATTETGNQDYTYVSVGFYNGIDIKFSAGPSVSEGGKLGYGELDWKVVKNYGIDFAIVRAGYSKYGLDPDPYFVENIENAFAENMNVIVSYDGYAKDASDAVAEAEYLVNYMNEVIPDYVDRISSSIVYNLYISEVSDVETLTSIIYGFQSEMKEAGYDVVVELGRTKFGSMNLEELTQSGIDLYMIYRPYVPDFTTRMSTTVGGVTYNADIWQYRTDAYFGEEGIAKKTNMSVIYMDYMQLDTTHKTFDESLYPEKPTLKVNGNYVYTGNDITASVEGFDSNTMTIEGNVAKDAGIYMATVKPQTKWKDGSSSPLTVSWEIEKADLVAELPQLNVEKGTALSQVELPEDYQWKDANTVVTENGKYIAIYVAEDALNYGNVEVEVTVTVIEPEQETEKEEPEKETEEEIEKEETKEEVKEEAEKEETKEEAADTETSQEVELLIEEEAVVDTETSEEDVQTTGEEAVGVQEDSNAMPLVIGTAAICALALIIILIMKKVNSK